MSSSSEASTAGSSTRSCGERSEGVERSQRRTTRTRPSKSETSETHHQPLLDLPARARIPDDDRLERIEPRAGRRLKLEVERLGLARMERRDDDRLDNDFLRLDVDDHRPVTEGPVLIARVRTRGSRVSVYHARKERRERGERTSGQYGVCATTGAFLFPCSAFRFFSSSSSSSSSAGKLAIFPTPTSRRAGGAPASEPTRAPIVVRRTLRTTWTIAWGVIVFSPTTANRAMLVS